jgi:hypothetical protein
MATNEIRTPDLVGLLMPVVNSSLPWERRRRSRIIQSILREVVGGGMQDGCARPLRVPPSALTPGSHPVNHAQSYMPYLLSQPAWIPAMSSMNGLCLLVLLSSG